MYICWWEERRTIWVTFTYKVILYLYWKVHPSVKISKCNKCWEHKSSFVESTPVTFCICTNRFYELVCLITEWINKYLKCLLRGYPPVWRAVGTIFIISILLHSTKLSFSADLNYRPLIDHHATVYGCTSPLIVSLMLAMINTSCTFFF